MYSAAVHTFRRCRVANESSDHVLTLGRCKPDQVIYIRRAIIGFSEEWNPADSQPRCGFRKSCAKSTRHDEITSCNGRQRCSFSQDVFNFPANKSCHRSTIANFIVVTYYCIHRKKTFHLFKKILLYFLIILTDFVCPRKTEHLCSRAKNDDRMMIIFCRSQYLPSFFLPSLFAQTIAQLQHHRA